MRSAKGHRGAPGGRWVGYRRSMTRDEMANLVLLRRARDLIDRNYAQPLDVPAMARGAHMSPAHFSREIPGRLRRDALRLSHDAAHRTRQGPLAPRRFGDRHVLRGWLHVARLVQFAIHRDRRCDPVALPRP